VLGQRNRFSAKNGAALTYARRYALFTLVGIAGEDDLDAPDLGLGQAEGVPVKSGEVNGNPVLASGIPPLSGSRKAAVARPVSRTLAGEDFSLVRADLEGELARLRSTEEALTWAQRVLPTKNTLADEDARVLEQAFEARMGELGGANAQALADTRAQDVAPSSARARAHRVPLERLPSPKPRRRRDKKHLE